jgi:hypothetical protein
MEKKSHPVRINPYDLNSIAERRDQLSSSRPSSNESRRPYEIGTAQKLSPGKKTTSR